MRIIDSLKGRIPWGYYGILAGSVCVIGGTFFPIARAINGSCKISDLYWFIMVLEYLIPTILAIIAGFCIKNKSDSNIVKWIVLSAVFFGILVHLKMAQEAISFLNPGIEQFREMQASALRRYENNSSAYKMLPRDMWDYARKEDLKAIAEAKMPVPQPSYSLGTYIIFGGYFLMATAAIFATGKYDSKA